MVAVKEIGKAVLVLITLSFAGCGTVQFSSPAVQTEEKKELGVVTGIKPEKSISTFPISKKEIVDSPGAYHYGNFTVEVTETGQRVLGGAFLPKTKMPQTSTMAHVIFINYTTKELSYYQRNKVGGYDSILGYVVITPKPEFLPKELVRGRVFKIDTSPWWCPTPNTRNIYPQLPAGCLPPGHKENAMGAAKFEVVWFDVNRDEWDTIRLHGTNGYPRGNFWDEETLGCTRLNDDAIKELITKLGPKAVREGIEVVLLKGGDLPPASQSAKFAL